MDPSTSLDGFSAMSELDMELAFHPDLIEQLASHLSTPKKKTSRDRGSHFANNSIASRLLFPAPNNTAVDFDDEEEGFLETEDDVGNNFILTFSHSSSFGELSSNSSLDGVRDNLNNNINEDDNSISTDEEVKPASSKLVKIDALFPEDMYKAKNTKDKTDAYPWGDTKLKHVTKSQNRNARNKERVEIWCDEEVTKLANYLKSTVKQRPGLPFKYKFPLLFMQPCEKNKCHMCDEEIEPATELPPGLSEEALASKLMDAEEGEGEF